MIKLFEKHKELEDTKKLIFLKAIETAMDTDLIDFFLERGYDLNTEDALWIATDNMQIFRYLLEKGINVEEQLKNNSNFRRDLEDSVEIQKALIDYGYELFIFQTIGRFNKKLKNDPKYAEVIDRFEDAQRYNL